MPTTPIREMIRLHPTPAQILIAPVGSDYDPRQESNSDAAYTVTEVEGFWASQNESSSGAQFTGTLTVEQIPDGVIVDSSKCRVDAVTYMIKAVRQRRWERAIAGWTLELGI